MAASQLLIPSDLKLLHPTTRVIDENAMAVIRKRYLKKDPVTYEPIETVDEMFRRVAARIASIDITKYDIADDVARDFANELYTGMSDHRFVMGGRNLVDWAIVPNCVVTELGEDTPENWEKLRSKAAKAQRAGCGLGFALHEFKPTMDQYGDIDLYSPGPVARLLQLNSDFTNIIQKSRNGANMACMLVTHPDIHEFIDCKKIEGSITSFNVSVMFTDEFLRRATDPTHPKYSEPWTCEYKGKTYPLRRIIRPASKFETIKIETLNLTAAQLLTKIVDNAHANGEPGFLYYDTANRSNPLPGLGPLQATNPCGEQWLHGYHSCLLLAINVDRYYTPEHGLLYEQLEHDVRLLVHAGDNIVDLFQTDVPEILDQAQRSRRLGIGVMGLADLFISMNITYGSTLSLAIADDLMNKINTYAVRASEELAELRGEFEMWPLSSFAAAGHKKRRNAAVTNVAPTGSTAKIFGASTGIEPVYSFAYTANVVGEKLRMVNSRLISTLDKIDLPSTDVRKQIYQRVLYEGTIQNIDEIPLHIRNVYKCAGDISHIDHILMQAACQKHIENAISKTINLPNSASKQDVLDVILLAWRTGCKGYTVYRDGSRVYQVLTTDKGKEMSQTVAASSSSSSGGLSPCRECNVGRLIREDGCQRCDNDDCGWSGCEMTPRRPDII